METSWWRQDSPLINILWFKSIPALSVYSYSTGITLQIVCFFVVVVLEDIEIYKHRDIS